MPKSVPAAAKSETKASEPKARSRAKAFTTATVISFSLTLFAGSLAVLGNAIPLNALSFGERVDLGAMLFAAPILALVLAVVFEATRIAFSREQLPEPRRQPVVDWTPGHREG
jgi:hypothetical protein